MRLCSSAVVINTVLSGHGIPNAQLGCIFLSSVLGFHQPHADVASRSREPQLVLHLYLFLRDAQKESIMHTYDSNINKYTNLKKACNQRCSDGGYIGIYTPQNQSTLQIINCRTLAFVSSLLAVLFTWDINMFWF